MGTTIEQIESYLTSVEEFLSSSLTSVAPDLPHLREIAHRVWDDITKFGPPSLPQIPGLGSFEIPPPPPPPTPNPPPSLWHWLGDHKWIVAGVSASIISTGLLAGYGTSRLRQYCARANGVDGKRSQIVVVIGADHPLGIPLVLGLEAQGYLVYASVGSKEAGEALQSKSKGYVLPLILDLNEPNSVESFLKTLASARLMRFPLTASGDPYSTTHVVCYLHSVISLANLFRPPSPCPFESVPFRHGYLSYLTQSHITPFHVIQGLLPQLRLSHRSNIDANIRKSIIFCLPAVASLVGVPFTSQESMSVSATVRGADILRRELQVIDALKRPEHSPSPRVVVIDVGAVGRFGSSLPTADPESLTRTWSESEKEAYSASFEVSIRQSQLAPRKPVHVGVFVNAVIGVVSQGTKGRGYGFGFREDISFATSKRVLLRVCGRVHNWIRGDRFSIGAGATTYSLVSHLPSVLVDSLLYIPHAVTAVRNALIRPPLDTPFATTIPTQAPAPSRPPIPHLIENIEQTITPPSYAQKDFRHDPELSDISSEADVESLSGISHTSGNERDLHVLLDSWIDINDKTSLHSSRASSVKE